MGNQPSGWSAPPYFLRVFKSSVVHTRQETPNGSFAGASTQLDIGTAAIANEHHTIVKLSNTLTKLYLLEDNTTNSPISTVLTYAGLTGAPTITGKLHVDLILADFNPAIVTWNNEGGLTYGADLTAGIPSPAEIVSPSLAAGGVNNTGSANFTAIAGFGPVVSTPIFGFRFRMEVTINFVIVPLPTIASAASAFGASLFAWGQNP